ncbi:hypothetical protein BDV33DRAFT_210103 [Aspergillus novoparasiticus]|uniref:Hemerythrin-like domain-containing protein n=1 Tax=Aspergillus novoparasiticus TaxID=986946 RepID=A0A5N6E9T9_9EURO|nr:hypothetical protein BDV33DRAFT_210103 [Aspergillus novoparasiticus]
MTTKPSSAPWVDEPFHLIATPSKTLDGSLGHVHGASEMAQAHNAIIRGLNAIIQQAPYVPIATDEHFIAQDVKDLLFYVQSWVKMVHHHHWVEETYIFPDVEEFTGRPGFMDDPKHQHELFHDGLERLLAYSSATKPEEYRWKGSGGMEEIINSFSKDLTDHLYAEIDLLLSMGDIDSDGLKRIWAKGEKAAKQTGNIAMFYDMFPLLLGCADKTYEGGCDFPPLPWVLPYVIKYWFAAGNGAWRFNSCDWWGQPKPLEFGPR